MPSTVTRQSIAIVDGANNPLPPSQAPLVLYDPIARTVTLAPPSSPWLTVGQPYKVILARPANAGDPGGIRAIDGAALWSGQSLEVAFFVGPPTSVPLQPTVSFCRDVLPIFAAKCSQATCHGAANQAAASLLLTSSEGVAATALGRVAQGSNTGPRSNLVSSSSPVFGVDMPIIDPGNPGNSWLMYKIELAPQPPSLATVQTYACQAGLLEPAVAFDFAPLAPNAQRAADSIERGILSDYVLGNQMPYPVAHASDYTSVPLTFQEREKVRLWIGSLTPGEAIPECGGCGDVSNAVTDAGATDQ